MGGASGSGAGASKGARPQTVAARIAGGHGIWETVTYACTLDGEGNVIKALDVDGPDANSYVTLAEAKVHSIRRDAETVESLAIVRHVTATGQEFCVRVTDEAGALKHVCDLEDYVVTEPGEIVECRIVPQAVLDSFLSGLAAGSTPL